MSFLNSFFINIFYKKVGEDQFGNAYYVEKSKNYLDQVKRYVTYKGVAEPSKIPPLWHAWLHYFSDKVPNKEKNYKWQQEHVQNLIKFSYYPQANNNLRNISDFRLQ